MGQLALGFKNLLIKATVFVIMAALLAWALGGTLWPRAEIVSLDSVAFQGRAYFWQVAVGGREPTPIRWTLMWFDEAGEPASVDGHTWDEVSGLVLTADGIWAAGRAGATWTLERCDETGVVESMTLPDRMAVEIQLARVRIGLPLEDSATVESLRGTRLDPGGVKTAHDPD